MSCDSIAWVQVSTHTNTYTHTHTYTYTYTHVRSLTPSLCRSLSRSLTQTNTDTHPLFLSHTHRQNTVPTTHKKKNQRVRWGDFAFSEHLSRPPHTPKKWEPAASKKSDLWSLCLLAISQCIRRRSPWLTAGNLRWGVRICDEFSPIISCVYSHTSQHIYLPYNVCVHENTTTWSLC